MRELLHAVPLVTIPLQAHDASEDFKHGETVHGVLNILGILVDPIDLAVAVSDLVMAGVYGIAALEEAREDHEYRMKINPEYKQAHDVWQQNFERMTESLNKKSTVGNKF